jgi:hypothetical protein
MLRTLYLKKDVERWKIIKKPINIDDFPTKENIKNCFSKAINNFSKFTQEKWEKISKELIESFENQWFVDHRNKAEDPTEYPKENIEGMLNYIGFTDIYEFIDSVGL